MGLWVGLTASYTVLGMGFAGEVGNFSEATPKISSCVILMGKNLSRKLWNGIVTFWFSK